MATSSTTGMDRRLAGWACLAANRLACAAAPAFALMAMISASDNAPMLCMQNPDALGFDGMPVMYLLMSLFHLPPWLRLISSIGRASNDH